MAVRTRSDVPASAKITGGTDTSGDANLNDEFNGILGLSDGNGSFDVVHKQGLVVNNASGNFDTQIKGDTDDNLLFADASADKVGIGTNAPLAKLHVDNPNDTASAEYARFDSTSATPADNDERFVNYNQRNDGGSNETYARQTVTALDITSGTEKGQWKISVADGVDGSIDDALIVDIDGIKNQVPLQQSTVTGITASVTQTQGQGLLTGDINEVAIVANDDDSVTMRPATVGGSQTIINNGANRLQIFPFSDDDLGQGVDTATSIPAGTNITFKSINTINHIQTSSTTILWQEKILTSNITTNGVIADLTFTLTPGKTYRIHTQFSLAVNAPSPDGDINVEFKDGANVVGRVLLLDFDTGNSALIISGNTTIYTMVGSSLTFNAQSASANASIVGSGDRLETFVIVEELPDHIEGTVT